MAEIPKPKWGQYFFHFTAKSNLPSILREGLKPRGDRPANCHGEGLDSQPHLVHLTNKFLRPWHCFDYENSVVLAITEYWLDYSLICPDEDDPDYEGQTTLAYAGIIEPDAIDIIYTFEPVRDERGVLSYSTVETLSPLHSA